MFTSAKGILPPVRAFIDHSVVVFADANRRLQEGQLIEVDNGAVY